MTSYRTGDLREDLNDSADEIRHRAAAGGEKIKRAVAGPEMSVGDKIASHVKEAGHNVAAGIDRAKRDGRDGSRDDDADDVLAADTHVDDRARI
jgi:hypothetical protein